MSGISTARRSLALTTALLLTAFGAAAVPAFAEHGNGNAQSHTARSGEKAEKKGDKNGDKKGDKNGDKAQGGSGQGKGAEDKGPGNGNGNGNDNGGGNGNGGAPGGAAGDPAGNNGTVKITPHGELDGIPQNTPHVSCVFDIEWYGFDEGDDIVSTVHFAMQAPTSDVVLSGTEPSQVFVGGDPASGAGTDSGFDGEATYRLGFDGEPHAQQGYHVKLTVHTPYSQGADTKHKVFWVEPCEQPAVTGEQTGGETGEETEGATDEQESVAGEDQAVAPEVAGVQASAGAAGTGADAPAQAEVAGAQEEVPTAVDAGEERDSVVDVVTSPMWLLLIGCGLAVAGAALLARRSTS